MKKMEISGNNGKKIQVHIPYPDLMKRLDEVLDAGLNPEIYMTGESIEAADPRELSSIGEEFRKKELRITLHGPYMDLSPGGVDEGIRAMTVERFLQTLDAASAFGAATVVLHADYDARRFDDRMDVWFAQSLKSWPQVVAEAERIGTVIVVENIFEETPESLKALVEKIDSPSLRVCLDTGHLNLFSKVSMEEWFTALGPLVGEVHIHDNRGDFDAHLPVGGGNIEFDLFFKLLKEHSPDPVYTVEAHDEELMWKAIEAVKKFL
ncbi:MAG: sugar phosphate isomerase/epimerase family protein [Thermodesulfobacteriota bacterium]